ncbi:chaplin family protein [Sphaerisporangium aureirubrum]|uniref:Chaplin family protein n=1 Tax=Sphaerisporangium aureirubrum TaxID=1544736 RepID=A0ABW1NWL8_9ACTN
MRTWAKATAPAVLAVGVMALSGGTALADTSGTGSIGGGNQVNLPINLPVDISGNSAAVAGESSASSQGGASVQGGSGAGSIPGSTSGSNSVLGGNQVNAPINAPINFCGNAASLFGRSDARCRGGATVKSPGPGGGTGGNRTDGRNSVLGGNQVNAPVNAPINFCGNALAVFGEAVAGCTGGAVVKGGGASGAGGNRTSGRSSVLGGNQVVAPITAPVNICGNSIALIGEAFSGCRGGAKVKGGNGGYVGGAGRGAGGNVTDGRHSVGGGNQVVAPITAPVLVCGNVLGAGRQRCEGGVHVPPAGSGSGAGGNLTSGKSSVLGGNQVVAPIAAAVNVCGNAVAVLGDAFAGCRGGASVGRGGGANAGGNLTSGRSSVLGGNQVVAPIAAAVNVCGNAVAVLGDAAAGCLGGASVGGHHGGGHGYARSSGAMAAKQSGLLPVLPLLPLAPERRASAVSHHQSGGPVPPGGEAPVGTPALPALPVLPGEVAGAQQSGGDPLAPVKDAVSGTPAGDLVKGDALGDLPVGRSGLMSAEQPVGVTGMNAASLGALLAGGVFAAAALFLAGARRLRPRRR